MMQVQSIPAFLTADVLLGSVNPTPDEVKGEESAFPRYSVLVTRYSLAIDNWQPTTGFHGN
jgi:hypothetical protein